MHNCFSQGFGHERIIIKSEDFFLNESMFIETVVKVLRKSEKLTVLLHLRFLSKSSFKSFISNELQSRYNFALAILQNFRAMLQNLVEILKLGDNNCFLWDTQAGFLIIFC